MSESDNREVAPRDRSRIERIVWAGLGVKSARQISEEAGIPPDEVLRIKRELLDSVDVLTIAEKRQKLIVDLQGISRKVQDDYDKSPMEFKAGLMNSSIAAMKVVLVELARMEKADQSKVERLNQLRKDEIVKMYVSVVDEGVVEIAEKYNLNPEELFDVFNQKMREYSENN